MTSDSIETDDKPCPLTVGEWVALLAAESHIESGKLWRNILGKNHVHKRKNAIHRLCTQVRGLVTYELEGRQ